MELNNLKHELQHILQGKSPVSQGELIQAIATYLRESTKTGSMAQTKEPNKNEETKKLVQYINENNLWNCDINFGLFISQGAEQRVFLQNKTQVLKLNDSIYYASWLDYLNNLLLNNYFFPDTAYQLLGFYKSDNDVIYSLVAQNYVESNQPTDLNLVKQFLENNGFKNTKNNDYFNPNLGIILEDFHDENVLTSNDILYFIDTVFYIKPEIFWF
jgi:hypothetical protein